jgi:hypothetical protein
MLTYMRFGYCAVLVVSACYAPAVIGGAPCDPVADSCPTGQACVAARGGNFCSTGGALQVDAGSADSGSIKEPSCYGSSGGLLGRMCFASEPTGAITLANATINTASVGTGNCTEIRPGAGGGSPVCFLIASTINIAAGTTVRALGANPLVLIAARTITISGTLDASTRFGETIGGLPALGSGARSAAQCNALGIDGTTGNATDDGGGGGAGGSFGSVGAIGGDGRFGTPHGNPRPVTLAGVLGGGCPGGRGGDGNGGGGGGLGGIGGGAMYLIAGSSITIGGATVASGGGGGGGGGGSNSGGGAGGGGSGGMIGLDAPQITVTGSVYANGGGGGGGNGNDFPRNGTRGADPSAPLVAATGGIGGDSGGGNGGNGAVGVKPAAPGVSGGQQYCAGGGGGGGVGVVRVFGVPPASLTGSISPPPT